MKHPGPCPRPSHLWFAHSFAPFCAACRALAAWLDRPRKSAKGGTVRRFVVWRVPHPTIDLIEYPRLRAVEVADSDGPREAAVEWAHALDLSAETVVRVREVLAGPKGETEWGDVSAWTVEPVTTYRARQA